MSEMEDRCSSSPESTTSRARGTSAPQLIALWVTAVSLVILLIAYAAFPGFWPPMSPQMSADSVAELYRNNTAMIGSAW